MRKLILFSFLFIFLLFSIGCKKDSSTAGAASFSAKVEGIAWTATQIAGVASSNTASTSITATNTSGEQIVIAFYTHNRGTITFKENDPYSFGSFASAVGSYTTYNSSSPDGTIIITLFDKSQKIISGSFSFVGESSSGGKIHITDGKFDNVPY